MERLATLPAVRALLARGGVRDTDWDAVHTAVVQHCLPDELDDSHPHRRLTALLKDAERCPGRGTSTSSTVVPRPRSA